jgi:hypothetical protein
MLSSLCPVMAANLSVSYFRFGHLASVPVAGSIGTWIVARLYSEWPLCGRTTTQHAAAEAGRSRQWQAPAR